jgi:hypothetical protein
MAFRPYALGHALTDISPPEETCVARSWSLVARDCAQAKYFSCAFSSALLSMMVFHSGSVKFWPVRRGDYACLDDLVHVI